ITEETGKHLTTDDKGDKDAKGKEPTKEEVAKDSEVAADRGAAAAKKETDKAKATEEDALVGKAPEKTKIDAVLVADIDWIAPIIFRLREMGQDPDSLIDFKFQNVAFVLNILDEL